MAEQTLDELLQSLDIELEADEKDDENKDEETFNLETIPEELRESVKAELDARDDKIGKLDNTIASQGLAIDSLKESFEKAGGGKVIDEKKEENAFGLKEDDFYLPIFKKLGDGINEIKGALTGNAKNDFNSKLEIFATKNPDIVKYAKDMDELIKRHPTMGNDLPTLYKMGKDISERREAKRKEAETKNKREKAAGGNELESGGIGKGMMGEAKSTTIADAFDKAQTKLTKV